MPLLPAPSLGISRTWSCPTSPRSYPVSRTVCPDRSQTNSWAFSPWEQDCDHATLLLQANNIEAWDRLTAKLTLSDGVTRHGKVGSRSGNPSNRSVLEPLTGILASGSEPTGGASLSCLGLSEAGRSATTTAGGNSANHAEHSAASTFTRRTDVPHSSSSCHEFRKQCEILQRTKQITVTWKQWTELF